MRRTIIAVAVALSVVTAAFTTAHSEAATPGSPMAFGFFAGNTKQSSVQSIESSLGRPVAYVRVYRRWDDAFPDTDVNWMRSTGHSLFLSIKARRASGSNVSYTDIANAQPGSTLYTNMVRWATAIKAYGMPMYVAFNHEPDTSNSQRSGNATQFIAAWQKFVTVMRNEGVTNARMSWTTAVRNYSISPTSAKYAPKYYPGDAWVDVIAIDAYNMYCLRKDGTFSRPWRSLGQLLAPFMAFVSGHPGIDLVVAEWGTPEDPANPNRKAQWIADAQQLFKLPGYERFVGISYWNQLSHNFDNCDFKVTSSSASLNAFKTMANDAFYSGTVS